MSASSIVVQPPTSPSSITGKRVAFSTLGCKVNTFETELIAQKLTGNEYSRVDRVDQADLYIINTCTVTAEADRQARQLVRRAIKANPQAWVVVTGCYAQMDPEACSAIPGVDLVVGNSQKLAIPEYLEDLYAGKTPSLIMKDIDQEISLPDELLQGFDGHSRAFVQIQQGCDQGCTFCIIHTARGPNRSFSAEMILRQCERLVLNGYKEIVLCGVDIGSYGTDFDMANENENQLGSLLKSIMMIDGDFRIRLSSIDPVHITSELISLIRDNDRICSQLHLSLQSANTLILKRMKRRASRELIYQRISELRNAIPDLVLSADILVGFPTETDEHFEDTLTAIDELEIAYPHVFSYSKRPGTPASRIPSQVPIEVRKDRSKQARELGQKVWQKAAKEWIGKTLKVVVESSNLDEENGVYRIYSRSASYFPVQFTCKQTLDSWATVKITGIGENSLLGRVVN